MVVPPAIIQQIKSISMESAKLNQLHRQFLKHIEESSLDGWLACNKTISLILGEQAELSASFKYDVSAKTSKIGNLLTLLLVFNHKFSLSSYKVEERAEQLIRSQAYEGTDQWIASQPPETQQAAIELVLENLCLLLQKMTRHNTVKDLRFVLTQFNRFEVKRERDMNIVVNFMARMQQFQLPDLREVYETKETIIIEICCQILASQPTSGNLGLILDQFLISHESRSLQRFISLQDTLLLQMGEDDLLNIFKGLTKRCITFTALHFFQLASNMLAKQEEFYKLRHLYEQWVLPDLSRRAKCCHKPKTEEMVEKICQFFVIGFLHHCQLNKTSLECLLSNIDHVQKKENKDRWIALCSIVADKEEKDLKSFFESWLRKGSFEVDEKVKNKILKSKDNFVFEITTRSIRKRKAFKMEPSNLKGIKNHGNQCYIISVVQALFTTKRLSALVDKTYPKRYQSPNIYNLREMFKELASDRERPPSVISLKSDGPAEFAKSEGQEDAQNYLIRLLESLEKQFKKEGLLDEFKKLFEIETLDTLKCYKCSYKGEKKEQETVHTISHTHPFSLEYSEDITDYPCPECKNPRLSKTTNLTLKGSMLIVHINRFSVKNGATKKELPTQPILRKIKDFELVGILFHIGKRMEIGHYTYYSRVERDRWADMNDASVREFNLDSPDQPFETSMKAEKTPYILFYKKV